MTSTADARRQQSCPPPNPPRGREAGPGHGGAPDHRDITHDLINQGLHVFPLRPRDKVTLANCDRCAVRTAPCRDADTPCPCWPTRPCHGFRAATTDPTVTDQWRQRWPTANIGIYPWPSGHLVIDLDAKARTVPATLLPTALALDTAGVLNGVNLFARVLRHLGGTDRLDTRITRTPTGGLHVWFTAPIGVLVKSSRGEVHPDGHVTGLGWQIDVRAHGGYVVAPGCATKHGTYRVIRDRLPMPLPDWLAWWLHQVTHDTLTLKRGQDKPPYRAAGGGPGRTAGALRSRAERIAQGALDSECRQIAGLSDGRKAALNKAAYKLGGYVAAGYLSADEVTEALTEAGRAAGATRITTNVRSGLTAGMTRPRYLHDVA